MERDELAAWLRLLLTPRLGAQTQRRLLARFGWPSEVFAASPVALQELLTPAQHNALRQTPAGLDALVDSTLAWLALGEAPGQAQRRLISLADEAYPQALLQTEDPPLLLHALGNALHEITGPLDWPARAVAMVGSRNPTPQGAQTARQFAHDLAQAGWTVVSGLALGVDTAAHDGALEGAAPGVLPTVAVVGTGLDRVYPRHNQALAQRIAARGLVLSEFTLGTPPLQENFPRRNRLIAALSRGTLVVEAAVQSGSLITARLAAELGREVYAIPGSIHAPQARGCHALIKQGAQLVETVDDVLGGMGSPSPPRSPNPGLPPPASNDSLIEALGHGPCSLEALEARTGLGSAALLARLLELELQGAVGRMPGGQFQRLAQA
jgi:DNA processing protein